jgi:hypothetical protein
MKTVFITLLFAIFCLASTPTMARQITPSIGPNSSLTYSPTKIIRFDGIIQNKKIMLNWTVADNENTGMFELQRSTDGVNFTTAAIVFGTDKENTDSYQFYEKARSTKNTYRLKIIYKDNKVEFSEVINVNTPGR